jgi:nicotinic acid mononucleotide adenylyltransferase
LEKSREGDRTEAGPSTGGIEVRAFVLIDHFGTRAPLYVLPGLDVDISASDIRAQIHAASGSLASGRELVPNTVRDYIVQHNLYRS